HRGANEDIARIGRSPRSQGSLCAERSVASHGNSDHAEQDTISSQDMNSTGAPSASPVVSPSRQPTPLACHPPASGTSSPCQIATSPVGGIDTGCQSVVLGSQNRVGLGLNRAEPNGLTPRGSVDPARSARKSGRAYFLCFVRHSPGVVPVHRLN